MHASCWLHVENCTPCVLTQKIFNMDTTMHPPLPTPKCTYTPSFRSTRASSSVTRCSEWSYWQRRSHSWGTPASSSTPASHRNKVFHDFRNGECRNLVSTGEGVVEWELREESVTCSFLGMHGRWDFSDFLTMYKVLPLEQSSKHWSS